MILKHREHASLVASCSFPPPKPETGTDWLTITPAAKLCPSAALLSSAKAFRHALNSAKFLEILSRQRRRQKVFLHHEGRVELAVDPGRSGLLSVSGLALENFACGRDSVPAQAAGVLTRTQNQDQTVGVSQSSFFLSIVSGGWPLALM